MFLIFQVIPNPEVVEIQSDSDFEAALIQMDDVDLDDWEKKPKCSINTLSPEKSTTKIPNKTENTASDDIGQSNSFHSMSPEKSPYTTPIKKDKSSSDDIVTSNSVNSHLEKSPRKIPNCKDTLKIIRNNKKDVQEKKV